MLPQIKQVHVHVYVHTHSVNNDLFISEHMFS